MQLKDRSDQPHGTWEEAYRGAKRADRSRNDLHERDEGELERTGQPLCIYEPYFGQGTWSFLHLSSLYRGVGLVSLRLLIFIFNQLFVLLLFCGRWILEDNSFAINASTSILIDLIIILYLGDDFGWSIFAPYLHLLAFKEHILLISYGILVSSFLKCIFSHMILIY